VLSLALIPPGGEGLELRFRRRWLHVAKRFCKRGGPSFYLSKDTFNSIPISIVSYLKSEAESLQRGGEMVCSVDEENRVLDLLFVAEFTEKQDGELRDPGLKQPDVKEIVGLWIDGGVRPVAFVVDPNHCFIHRDLIRKAIACRR